MNRPIIIAICIFITLTLIFLLISPKYQTLVSFKTKIEEKKNELDYLKAYFVELGNFYKDLKGHEPELSKIESALPSDVSPSDLLYFIQTKTSQNGLVLKSASLVTITPSLQRSDIKEYHFSIELSGFYPAFKNFLSTLEESGRLIEIERISFSSTKEKEPASFGVGIKVYSY